MKKSPMYYAGNKYRLLKQIKQYFPNKINTFYDLFGGSGTVAINFVNRAKKVVYNEYNVYVYDLFNFYLDQNPEKIHQMTLKEIKKYGLPYGTKDKEISELKLLRYRDNYQIIEDNYFELDRKDPFKQHILKQFSFANELKYNADGFIKQGFGKMFYKPDIMLKNMWNTFNSGIHTLNRSYVDLMKLDFKKDDFVYIDPPYWNTNANYNKIWTWELETKLLEWLNELTEKGIKWALSNVFKHRGQENIHLKEWAAKGEYNIFYPKINYTLGTADKTGETIEVFITNYDPVGVSEYTEQLTLGLF